MAAEPIRGGGTAGPCGTGTSEGAPRGLKPAGKALRNVVMDGSSFAPCHDLTHRLGPLGRDLTIPDLELYLLEFVLPVPQNAKHIFLFHGHPPGKRCVQIPALWRR